jgi:rubredoxin
MGKYRCPCCGYLTLDEKPPGTYQVCPVCFWEDDSVQYHEPDYEGGANKVSLNKARNNYHSFGAIDQKSKGHTRRPLDSEKECIL